MQESLKNSSTNSEENNVDRENATVDLSQSMSNTSALSALTTRQGLISDLVMCSTGHLDLTVLTRCEGFVRGWFDQFENVSEAYLLTLLASLGILFNFLALAILSRDRRMRPMSKILNCLFLCSEQVFLGLIIVYFQMRSWYYLHHTLKIDPSRLEQFNYLTSALGSAQTFAVWMLYVASVDAYRSVRQLAVPEKIFQIRRAPLYVLFLAVSVVAYYALYLPPVRVGLYHSLDSYNFTLCNVPYENNWDFVAATVEQTSDIFYVLFYGVGFLVFAYVLPFVSICCRDKDIIDVLHVAQAEQKAVLSSKFHVLYPAVVTSVTCNVYLVCVALKMVILTFRVFEYALHYLTESALVFFQYLNVYSNFLQVLKSSLHLFILLIYDRRLKHSVMMKISRKRRGDSQNDGNQ